jgi:hypothetical protein
LKNFVESLFKQQSLIDFTEQVKNQINEFTDLSSYHTSKPITTNSNIALLERADNSNKFKQSNLLLDKKHLVVTERINSIKKNSRNIKVLLDDQTTNNILMKEEMSCKNRKKEKDLLNNDYLFKRLDSEAELKYN